MSSANFNRLWTAQATSAFGSRLTRTALPVIAVLTIDATPTELGVLSALSVAPGAAVGLLAGGTIDRTRKRRILIGADLFRLVLLLTVPLAAWTGLLSMVQLYGVAALAGVASTLFQITDNTYLPVIVDDDQLLDANARLETTEAAAEITGPGIAGVLIDTITAPLTIIIDAATYAVSALFLWRIDAREQLEPPVTRPSLASDIAAGAKAVWAVPIIRSLLIASGLLSFFGGFFFALFYIFCLKVVDLSAWEMGWIISVGGVGALFGAALAARIKRSRRAIPVLFVLLGLSQLGGLFIPLADGAFWIIIGFLVAQQLIGDGFRVAFTVFAVSLRQALVSREKLGRANATFQVVESALLPVGALVAGGVASLIGVREALWVGVIGGLTAPLVFLFLWRDGTSLNAGQTTT